MASTVTASTLTVSLTESINLNGQEMGATNTLSLSSINEVSKRIVTTDGTTTTSLVSFHATASSLGQFIEANVRYVRITNLDDTNFATLRLTGDASTDFAVRLDPGASYVITSSKTTGVVDYADISGTTLEDLALVAATANTAAVDLEVFVASV